MFRLPNTLRVSLVRVKTCTQDLKKKGVVYEIPCKECDEQYVGDRKSTEEEDN